MNSSYYIKSKVPPLWAWGCVVCLLLLLLTVYTLFFKDELSRLARTGIGFIPANTLRLKQFTQTQHDRNQIRVISIGTSLTRYATYPNLERTKRNHNFPEISKIQLLNISQPGGFFSDFTPLLPIIINSHPDFLVVHSDLFKKQINRPKQNNPRQVIKKLATQLTSHLFSTKIGFEQNQIDKEIEHQKNRVSIGNQLIINDEHNKLISQWYGSGIELPNEFKSLISTANEHNIQIIILNIARHHSFEQKYTQVFKQWELDLNAQLAPFKNILIWHSPNDFKRTDYHDFAHLNEDGRKKFMSWFIEKIRRSYGSTFRQ